MAEQLDSNQGRLALTLEANDPNGHHKPRASAKIVTFVDATTLDLRREAVQRVRASGIFRLSESYPDSK